jgi:pyruvate carboxylase
MSCRAAKAADY